MLRLRRNIQPRVSNHLAALSALLLLVSSLAGMEHSAPEREFTVNHSTTAPAEFSDIRQEPLATRQTATRQGIKISLLIFGR